MSGSRLGTDVSEDIADVADVVTLVELMQLFESGSGASKMQTSFITTAPSRERRASIYNKF